MGALDSHLNDPLRPPPLGMARPTMTAQPKPTAADVLREHEGDGELCHGCLATAPKRPGVPDRHWIARHQADMLAAAGLLATAEPIVVEVHHHDIEKHAESFNEGYETAVAQGLADDPTLAADWLAEHDAQVLRDAADEIRGWTAEGGPRRARVARGVIANVAGYLDRRAKRIAGGAT